MLFVSRNASAPLPHHHMKINTHCVWSKRLYACACDSYTRIYPLAYTLQLIKKICKKGRISMD